MFVKWPSIENTYQQKQIDWWLELYPELENEEYVITEKLHGSNVQWFVCSDESVRIGSRNGFLDIKASFQGANLLDLYRQNEKLICKLQNLANSSGDTYRLFGELIGPKVQKGVNYGSGYQIRYFGYMINDVLIPVSSWISDIAQTVPIIGVVSGLKSAIDFDARFDSVIIGESDNICEGVVIQPYNRVYKSPSGSTFILKKKNEEYKERASKPNMRQSDPVLDRLNADFKAYITDNRIQSVFSKHGVIDSSSQIGEYIRYVLEDAKEEFEKDVSDDINDLGKGQLKAVYNVGGMIANMLKKYL